MTKLSETQQFILARAAQREDRTILPLPEHIRGGAVKKVVTGLMTRGLVTEIPAALRQPAWREDADGSPLTLAATDAGLAAIGIEPDSAPERPDEAPTGDSAAATPDATEPAHTPPKTRTGTKQALLIDMLRTEGGATIPEIVEATGWQAHTVRGAISGALKKKLGLAVTSETVEGRGRVYRLPPA